MPAIRYEMVNLSSPPDMILTGAFEQMEGYWAEVIQPVSVWTLYYYFSANAVTINSRTYPVQDGDIGVFPPAARIVHAKTGPGTKFDYLSFDMPGKGNLRAAMPPIVRNAQFAHEEWVRAGLKLQESITPLRAFAWNFMCNQSVNIANLRQEAILYDAEAWIIKNLAEDITVTRLCTELSVSSRHLLRAFRNEHGITIQEFIIQRRIREAARLLLNTDKAPKVIAQEVGIPNLQHFNKLMRSHTGASPRSFRELKGDRK